MDSRNQNRNTQSDRRRDAQYATRPADSARSGRAAPQNSARMNGAAPRYTDAERERMRYYRENGDSRRAPTPRREAVRPPQNGRPVGYSGDPRRAPGRNTRPVSSVRRKATREQMREERRRSRKRAAKTLFSRFLTYIVMLLIIGAASAGAFFIWFYNAPDSGENSVTYFESYDGGKTVKSTVSGDSVYHDGVLYVNFSSIAEGCSMTSITDKNTAKFVLPDGSDTDSEGSGKEEYVIFTKDSIDCEISTQEWRLSSKAYFSSGEVWIPADFVTDFMTGIEVTENRDKGEVTVKRVMAATASGDSSSSLEPVAFNLKSTVAPDPVDPGDDTTALDTMPEVTFTSDLSAYEAYMDPADNSEYLLLVNKTTKVDAALAPTDLTEVKDTRKDGRATQKMREYAEKSLEALFIEMRAFGYTDVTVTSAYRSYEYQDQLYNSYVNTEMSRDATLTLDQAKELVSTYSARPGESEHQTGLCCDMHNLSQASTEFSEEAAYGWLSENAWKFGFILRFPEDKTEITGYSFEPWHYRFVGRRAAWEIKNGGLCLEEYLENR